MNLLNWLVVLLVFPAVFIGHTTGDFPSGAHQAVRCMLAHQAPEDCASLAKVIVPSYLLQEYNNSPPSLHEALLKATLSQLSEDQVINIPISLLYLIPALLKATLSQLSEDQVINIPISLLYLIPRARLADLSINQLRSILQKHADDRSLIHQVAACLQHDNNMSKFIDKMNVSIPEEALRILAESMEIADLTEEFLKLNFIENKPLLAYLRPTVLFNVETTTLYSIYNVLRMAESKPPRKSAFYFLTEAAIKHRAPLSKLKGFVMGLNPDQLLDESIQFDVTVSDFRQDLSLLQARALFERSFQNETLSSSSFIDSKPLLYKLSPELLLKFPQNVQKYEVNLIEQIESIPLPTASQITEYVMADCIKTRRLPKEDEFWDINIRHLGKWVYTLPLSSLEGYKSSTLSTAVLKTLESPVISPIQAYYLTARGKALDVMTPNTILDLETFLHALPASQLVNQKLGEIKSSVKLLLVSKLPSNNLARTLSLVNKIASSIGDPVEDNAGDGSVLEELLGNRDVNHIMALLSPKDLALSAEAMLKFFADEKIRNLYAETIEQLPQQILTVLLDHERRLNPGQWRWSSLLDRSQVSNLLVGGLTCQHIEEMDTGLFIPIMARYNTARKKQFPKNLQHCCLEKLINHLKLKMNLSQTDSDSGLISLLEPIEIESIGGYGLVDIPLDALRVSPYLGHILSKIGQLSSTELMLSTDFSRLKLIAELAVDKDGSVNTFVIRNLVWFLPPTAKTPDLRLMLEARLIDTTICLPAETRLQVAARLISAFGSPEQWTAGVLAALQDLLVVFSTEELSKIPLSSWTNAADSLVTHYNDLVEWIEPTAFYKVCASMLGKSEENEYKSSISRLVSWHLTSAQRLLDTVVSLPKPDNIKQNYRYEESKMPLTVFNPQMETELTDENDEDEHNESTEESTSDISTIDTSTTEESTTETSTTEQSTTEESTTEKSTTEKSTTEKSTTEKSTTEKSTTEKTTTEKSTTEKTTTEKNAKQERTTGKTVDVENSEHHPSINNVTQNTKPDNISADKFRENIFNSTGETSTKNMGEGELLILNGTTEEPVQRNDTSASATNTYIIISNGSSKPSGISYESADNTKSTPLCANSVNKEECQNSSGSFNLTEIEFLSIKSTTELYVKRDNKTANNDTNSYTQVLPKLVNIVLNKTSRFLSQNVSVVPIKIQFNQTKDQTKANISLEASKVSPVTPFKTQNNTFYEHYFISNSTIPYNTNKSENTQTPKIYNIAEENLHSNQKPGEYHESGEVEEEEEISVYSNGGQGILMDSKKEKRSIFFHSSDTKLSCKAIKMVGSIAGLALTDSDLSEMSASEIADCRMEFGAMELSEALQKTIWKSLDTDLKLDGIHLLGRLLRVMSVADLWYINFQSSEAWVLETIHAIIQHNNNTMVMNKFMREVVKTNTEFSVDLLAMLGPAVCSLDPKDLKALSVIGLDLGTSCPSCLPYLALRATEELGSVNTWTQHFVHSIQAIVAGLDLDSWKQLAASEHKPLSGLQPSATKCLNTSHLEVLSPDQIRMIPTVSLLALSDQQLAVLNTEQLEALKSVTSQSVTDKMTPTKQNKIYIAGVPTGNSNKILPTVFFVTFLTVLNIINN